MAKDNIILIGAGQIGVAIARRVGYGKKIIIGDKNLDKAKAASNLLNEAFFDTEALQIDISLRASVQTFINEALKHGNTYVI